MKLAVMARSKSPSTGKKAAVKRAPAKAQGTEPTRKPGRPTLYRAAYNEQAVKLARLGATDKELADFFEIDLATLNRWKIAHPQFCESIKTGKEVADAEVADKLFKRATGYEHEAVKIVADAKTGAEHQVKYTERYPPDTTAMIFWLKNRRPDLWRDRVDNTHAGPDGGPIQARIGIEFVNPPARAEDQDA